MKLRRDLKSNSKMSISNSIIVTVIRKIKDNKQHTINEGKKVNDSLKQFQDKFIHLMLELSDQLNLRIREEEDYMESERVRAHDRLAYLEEMLSKERSDRTESLDS